MSYLPDELEALRAEQNLSVREVARRAGISHTTTHVVFVGRGLTTSVVAVARALGWSVRWTFFDSDADKRRLLLLPGSLQTQASVWRSQYVGASIYSLAAPGLTRDTMHKLELGRPTHFATLERYGRLLGLETILVRGDLGNVLDVPPPDINTGESNDRRQHC